MPEAPQISQAQAELEQADAVFSALAHPARRQILLSVWYRQGASAGEIAKRFSCSWPTTSRHLAKLVEAGLLSVTREGRERRYQVSDKVVREVLTRWLSYFQH